MSRQQSAVLYLIVALALLGAVLAENTLLVLASTASIVVVWLASLASVERVAVAGVLTLQWLQISTKVVIAEWFGIDLGVDSANILAPGAPVFFVYGQSAEAIYLSLAALVAVSIATKFILPRETFANPLWSYPPIGSLLLVYVILLALSVVAGPVFGGSLAQLFISLGEFRFAALLAILFLSMNGVTSARVAVFAILFVEIVIGFAGFFSGFKTVFIVAGIGYISYKRNWFSLLKIRFILLGGLAAALLLVWTAIKIDYRRDLNQGSNLQSVTINVSERAASLARNISNLDNDAIDSAVVSLGGRIAYTDFFALSMDFVPAFEGHTNGGLWSDAALRSIQPRFLFPGKAIASSDSSRTSQYTGVSVAGEDQGTSISMGWVAETFVDFGRGGVVIFSLILGALIGLLVRLIRMSLNYRNLWAYSGVIVASLLPLAQFEISITKLLPGLMIKLVVAILFLRFIAPIIKQPTPAPPLLQGRESLPRPANIPRA